MCSGRWKSEFLLVLFTIHILFTKEQQSSMICCWKVDSGLVSVANVTAKLSIPTI